MGNCWGAKISSDSPSRGAISPSGSFLSSSSSSSSSSLDRLI